MKHKIIMIVLMVFILGSCGNNKNTGSLNEEIYEGEGTYSKIDVDLTKLSSTMVYSEVNNIMTNPKDYEGKVIKMNGFYTEYTNEDESAYYPALIISDATACCAQGIEFLLKDDKKYPDDYPSMDEEVTVVGLLESYDEDGTTYYHVNNCDMVE